MDTSARRQDSNVFVLDKLANVLDPVTNQARECLRQQAAAIAKLSSRLDESFARAVRLLFGIEGHVVITGLGKSGLVGRKIAATLASTGTPSFFVHAGEALHGDLGMITETDAVVLISYSGETSEVTALLPYLRRRGVPTIGLVGDLDSSLAKNVDVAVDVSVDREVCPNNLAPTSSTLATLAIGDTLAVSLMRLRGFVEEDFAQLHPGGSVGRRLARVGDAVVCEGVTVVSPDTSVSECLLMLAASTLPIALVCDGSTLVGVVTADDVRLSAARASAAQASGAQASGAQASGAQASGAQAPEALAGSVAGVMNRTPSTIEPGVLMAEAERRMAREGVSALVVVDAVGEVSGVLPRRR
jgi:arabinose-5-phosphate isomerase